MSDSQIPLVAAERAARQRRSLHRCPKQPAPDALTAITARVSEAETTAALHLTIRERPGGLRAVEIPRTHEDQAKFPAGKQVIISLEDDPTIHIRATVWGGETRFATIRRDQEHAERFEVGKDVAVVIR